MTKRELVLEAIDAIASFEKASLAEVTVSVDGFPVSYAVPFGWEWLDVEWDSAKKHDYETLDEVKCTDYEFNRGKVVFTLTVPRKGEG